MHRPFRLWWSLRRVRERTNSSFDTDSVKANASIASHPGTSSRPVPFSDTPTQPLRSTRWLVRDAIG